MDGFNSCCYKNRDMIALDLAKGYNIIAWWVLGVPRGAPAGSWRVLSPGAVDHAAE
jgi:hypothetical protein